MQRHCGKDIIELFLQSMASSIVLLLLKSHATHPPFSPTIYGLDAEKAYNIHHVCKGRKELGFTSLSTA